MVLYYSPDRGLAFSSVQYLIKEVNNGWLIRLIHFNGASIIFIFLYLHFFKALFFRRYRLIEVWSLGVVLEILIIIEAFLGYSLVWGQISFWAATVITSLLGVFPFFGKDLICFIWAGFNLNSNTIKFFYLIHFITPFFLLLIVFFHLSYLHFFGRRDELDFSNKLSKRSFYPFYWVKDLINLIFVFIFFLFVLSFPFDLGDPLVSEELNELVSPIHIVPEWYFLWAYAILRAIPSKILGVFALLGRLLVNFFLVSSKIYPRRWNIHRFIVVLLFLNLLILTWVGSLEPFPPYVNLSLYLSLSYFFLVFLLIILNYLNYLIYFI